MIPLVDGIFQSCSSITKSALAAKTLGTKNQEKKNIDELIANEFKIHEWLKRQSIDFIPSQVKAAIETCRPRCLQEDLVDATLRQQQEDLLIKRLRMAASYPVGDLHQQYLVDQGLQAVFRLEQAALEKRQILTSLLSKIHRAEEERQRIHLENQDQWQQWHSKGNDTVILKNTSETLTLKRILQDIIVSSRVDIHHNKRLQEALMRCERR